MTFVVKKINERHDGRPATSQRTHASGHSATSPVATGTACPDAGASQPGGALPRPGTGAGRGRLAAWPADTLVAAGAGPAVRCRRRSSSARSAQRQPAGAAARRFPQRAARCRTASLAGACQRLQPAGRTGPAHSHADRLSAPAFAGGIAAHARSQHPGRRGRRWQRALSSATRNPRNRCQCPGGAVHGRQSARGHVWPRSRGDRN